MALCFPWVTAIPASAATPAVRTLSLTVTSFPVKDYSGTFSAFRDRPYYVAPKPEGEYSRKALMTNAKAAIDVARQEADRQATVGGGAGKRYTGRCGCKDCRR